MRTRPAEIDAPPPRPALRTTTECRRGGEEVRRRRRVRRRRCRGRGRSSSSSSYYYCCCCQFHHHPHVVPYNERYTNSIVGSHCDINFHSRTQNEVFHKIMKCFLIIIYLLPRMIFLLHSTAPQPPPTHPTHHEHPEKAPSARPSSSVSCSSSAARPSSPPLPPTRATTTGYAMYVWTRDHAISSTPNAAHCKTACIPSTTMARRTLSGVNACTHCSRTAKPRSASLRWPRIRIGWR